MCNPAVVVGLVGMAVSIASTTASSVMQGEAQKQQVDYQARVAANNALAARYERSAALQEGERAASAVERQGRRMGATARAQLSATDLNTEVGSVPNVFAVNAYNAAVDADVLRTNAARRALGFADESQDFLARRRMLREAGYVGTLGTGLQGLGSVASQVGGAATTYGPAVSSYLGG